MKKLTLSIVIAISAVFFNFLTTTSALATEPLIQVTAVPIGICTNSKIDEVSIKIIWPAGVITNLLRDVWAEEMGLIPQKSSATFFIPSSEVDDIEILHNDQKKNPDPDEESLVNFWTESGSLHIQGILPRIHRGCRFKIKVKSQGEEYVIFLGNTILPFTQLNGCEIIRLGDGTREIQIN